MMMVKKSIAKAHPDMVQQAYQLLRQSKAIADSHKKESPKKDLTPFGVEANRAALELLLKYSTQQGLIPKAYSMKELFGDLELPA